MPSCNSEGCAIAMDGSGVNCWNKESNDEDEVDQVASILDECGKVGLGVSSLDLRGALPSCDK